MILSVDNEGPEHTVRMRMLIWAFAVCICLKTRFHIARPKYRVYLTIFILNIRTHTLFINLILKLNKLSVCLVD